MEGTPDRVVDLEGGVTLDGSDIQLGAVELKDASTGNRAAVDSSGAVKTRTKTYSPVSGEFTPGVTAAQFPTITAELVRLKARKVNTGSVWVGDDGSVTVGNGTTDTTSGFELAPGDDSGWIPVANLNVFFGIGAGASDSVTYLVLA